MMKTPSHRAGSRASARRRRGVALVIVLASIALLVVLVVAFLGSVGTELTTSKVYANGASVKSLARTTVNLVQSEINDATHDGNLCWTSQPGMIRTFDSTGQPAKYFKLYSDDVMAGSGGFTASSAAPPADWYSRAGVYTDLNQPVGVDGVFHYPIVDGDTRHLTSYTPSASVGTVLAVAPIDTARNTPQVAGFWIKNAPLEPGTVNQAPMPVRWLYVLRDGSIVAPDSALDGNKATTFSGIQPDRDMKQIVGRIAFWTDDETSKVNINTAGEGACLDGSGNFSSAVWDTPRFRLGDYDTLSIKQPVQNEFQRYAGHPSTVSLSAVFGNLVTDGPNASGLSYPENIYALTPRVTQGGSQHGSISITSLTSPLGLRTDRLYDTVDEIAFQNNRTLNSALLAGPASLDQTRIENAKFFLTSSSHAPDINLFNRPRISMWPVSAQGTTLPYRSPKDQLIAFCSTVNNFGYYFQRQDPNDPYVDLPTGAAATGLGHNRQLLEYLRGLVSRPIPGFGGSLASKYNSIDTAAGGLAGGTREIDQILTETFDYIRSTNLEDQSMATTDSGGHASNAVKVYAPAITTAGYPYQDGGSGQVVPIVDQANGTRGFGRFPTLQQLALIFYASKDNGQLDGADIPVAASEMRAFLVPQMFIPAMGYPIHLPYFQIKVSGLTSLLWDSTDPTSHLYTTDAALLPGPVTNGINLMQTCGGIMGWRRLIHSATPQDPAWAPLFSTGYPTAAANPGNVSYSAATTAVPPGLGLTAFHFRGGPLTVEIYQKKVDGTTGTLLQSIKLTLPDAPAAGFPLPALAQDPPASGTGSSLPSHKRTWEDWPGRWASEASENQFPEIISQNDVIRAVVATPGDTRLVAARKTIDDTAANKFFKAHPRYAVPGENMAHDLGMSNGQTEYHASMPGDATMPPTGGLLVALTGSYYDGFDPGGYKGVYGNNYGREYDNMGTAAFWADVPGTAGVFVGGSGSIPGDWDNGLPSVKDGAYINKPDEGDTFTATDSPYFENSYGATPAGQTFFSPNRMIPSPGMLGSLSTGVLSNRPWQTLLFRPGPKGHPGLGVSVSGTGDAGPPYTSSPSSAVTIQGPPDHLFMDLFTMPVVEPYAISEPLATAGQVNMNYQIVPFTYINRNTGIQAALRGVQVISVPDVDAAVYKFDSYFGTLPTPSSPFRQPVDIFKTLSQFDRRFALNDVFRSATEICGIDLVPANYTGADPPTRASMDAYWATHRLAGDNSRERPYTNLYPLLTTKSNTFTVHFCVQTLKKVVTPNTNYAIWREGVDLVTGEYRGSETIERYIDTNNATDSNGNSLPNFADPANSALTLTPFYKFRVVSSRQFAP